MKQLQAVVSIFLFAGISIGLLFVILNGSMQYNYSKQEIVNKMESVLFKKTKVVDRFIHDQEINFYKAYDEKLFTKFLKMSPKDSQYNKTKEELYERFNQSQGAVMGLINSTGVFQIDKEGILEGFDIKDYPEGIEYLADPSKEPSYMILPHPMLDEFYILIATKIFDQNGSLLGIFSYRIPNKELKSLLNNITEFDGIGESYLINDKYFLLTPSKFIKKDNNGILIQVVNTSNAAQCINNYLIHLKKEEKVDSPWGETIEYTTYRGEYVMGIHSVIETPKWCLLVEVNKREILTELLQELVLIQSLIFVFIVLVFIIINYFLQNILTKNKKTIF